MKNISYLWPDMYLFEQGGGARGKTLSFSSEPVGGFHLNTISSKLLGITFPEKEPKILGEGWLLLAKERMDLNVLGNYMKCIDCDWVSVVPLGLLLAFQFPSIIFLTRAGLVLVCSHV